MSERKVGHPEFAELSTELLARGEAIKFKAHGSSMLPFIQDGDVLTVEPFQNSHWSIGQIVFYQSEDQNLIAHRIINKVFVDGEWRLSVRGDARNGIAEQISGDQVLGQVVYRQRQDKSTRIDRGWWRIAGVAWLVSIRFLQWGRKLGSRIKRGIRLLFR